jgi:hypothetical protein
MAQLSAFSQNSSLAKYPALQVQNLNRVRKQNRTRPEGTDPVSNGRGERI